MKNEMEIYGSQACMRGRCLHGHNPERGHEMRGVLGRVLGLSVLRETPRQRGPISVLQSD